MAKQRKQQVTSTWVNTPIIPQETTVPPVVKKLREYIVYYIDETTGEKKKTIPYTDLAAVRLLLIMRGGTIRDNMGHIVSKKEISNAK